MAELSEPLGRTLGILSANGGEMARQSRNVQARFAPNRQWTDYGDVDLDQAARMHARRFNHPGPVEVRFTDPKVTVVRVSEEDIVQLVP